MTTRHKTYDRDRNYMATHAPTYIYTVCLLRPRISLARGLTLLEIVVYTSDFFSRAS